MIDTWLTTPARLLYWSFFKPLTLRAYQRQFGVKLDSNGDFSLLSVRRQLRTNPALRRYVAQMGVALLLGLLPLFPLSVLAEMIRVAVTPDAVFNWAYVAGGVAFGVAVGVAVGVAGGVAVGVAFGVAVGVAVGVVVGVAVGVAGGVAFIPLFLLCYFRLPLFMLYWPWNTLLYWLARNRLVSWRQLYRRCPQNGDELIWLRLSFLDGLLVLLTQADRAAGLAAIDAVAASFRQGWAAARATERLLLNEIAQPQTVPQLAALKQQVAWLPPAGPQAYREALDRFCHSLMAAQTASSNLNRLTNLNRAQQTLRAMQTTLETGSKKQPKKSTDRFVDQARLQLLMDEQFTLDEIYQLCFELDIDYQTLPGTTKKDLIRELILYQERRDRLPRLLNLVGQQRPLAFQETELQQKITDEPFYLAAEFRRELLRWSYILDEEINRLTQVEAASPDIPNPYNPGLPLKPDGGSVVFQGRQDIFTEIEKSLLALNQPPTLLLHGPRRSGKTSLLYHLPHRLPETVVPVFVNLQEAAGTVQSPAGFVTALVEAIRDQAATQRGLTLPRFSPRDFEAEPYLSFANWLTQAERPLQAYTLFITFDEFEWVEKAIADGRLDENVLSFFRNLIQRGGGLRLALLFAGVHLLDEMQHNWASYFINVKTVHVGNLPEADARTLILNPIEDFPLDYEPEALALFLAQTRCQPYLIQLVAFDLVNYLNSAERRAQGDWRTVTLADVQTGFQKGLHSGYNYFADRWQICRPDEKLILADLAAGQELPPELDEGARLLALRRLTRRELVEGIDGRYQIQIPLVARWIQEEKLPALVRAEIRQS